MKVKYIVLSMQPYYSKYYEYDIKISRVLIGLPKSL